MTHAQVGHCLTSVGFSAYSFFALIFFLFNPARVFLSFIFWLLTVLRSAFLSNSAYTRTYIYTFWGGAVFQFIFFFFFFSFSLAFFSLLALGFPVQPGATSKALTIGNFPTHHHQHDSGFFSGGLTGHDATRGTGQEVFRNVTGRVGSGRVTLPRPRDTIKVPQFGRFETSPKN